MYVHGFISCFHYSWESSFHERCCERDDVEMEHKADGRGKRCNFMAPFPLTAWQLRSVAGYLTIYPTLCPVIEA